MAKDSRKVAGDEEVRADEPTTLETLIRQRARCDCGRRIGSRVGGGGIVARRLGAAGLPARDARANVDDESWADHVRDATRPSEDRGRRDRRMAERAGATVSTSERARR